MTKDEFDGKLAEIGFAFHPPDLSFRRADGAAMSVEFVDDLLAVWPDLVPQALKLWKGGAKALKVVSERTDGGTPVGRLEIVE